MFWRSRKYDFEWSRCDLKGGPAWEKVTAIARGCDVLSKSDGRVYSELFSDQRCFVIAKSDKWLLGARVLVEISHQPSFKCQVPRMKSSAGQVEEWHTQRQIQRQIHRQRQISPVLNVRSLWWGSSIIKFHHCCCLLCDMMGLIGRQLDLIGQIEVLGFQQILGMAILPFRRDSTSLTTLNWHAIYPNHPSETWFSKELCSTLTFNVF